MADPYRELSRKEADRADLLIWEASGRGQMALSRATLTAARVAIQSVQKSHLDDRIALTLLRTNGELRADIARDLALAERDALTIVTGAMLEGYEMDLRGRSAALASMSTGLRFSIEITTDDLRELKEWPIQGHLPAEAAAYQIQVLRYAVEGSIVQSAVSVGSPIAAVPDALSEVARLHGQRLGALAGEAFYAGIQKATRDLSRAKV